MSLQNTNNKGKAVVKMEQVADDAPAPVLAVGSRVKKEVLDPLTPVGTDEVVSPVTTEDDDDTIEGEHLAGSVWETARSSSSAPAPLMPAVPVPYVLIAPPAILPAFQRPDDTSMLLIKNLMRRCVTSLATGNITEANTVLLLMSSLASIDGGPIQRVAFTFFEALGRRALRMLPGLSWALQPQMTEPPKPAYKDTARRCLQVVCPFLRVASSVSNHAILTAMQGERHVHIVDLGGASPDQWLDMLRLFAGRPEGPPALRLTVVSAQEGFLSSTASLLNHEAVRLNVPFIFNPVCTHIDRICAFDISAFGVYHGEATAISSTLQLHRLIADITNIQIAAAPPPGATSASATASGHHFQKHEITKADALLRVLCDLSPKVMVVTEQEANHNGDNLWDRTCNAFDHYAVLFHDLEAGGAATAPDREAVERLLLREEIIDIVASDGSARRERHESMDHWVQRMAMAGFQPSHVMSFNAFADMELLKLQMSVDGMFRYWVVKDSTYLIIYSGKTPMFSVTAWRPARNIW
ncbi:hypothetical protein BS78_09G122500 [Paspalum vaginatum]|nr:hypothetical protein BS78_09G122500 [Paspalum vaginatum]